MTNDFTKLFRRFAEFIVAWAVILVWWGAAVTTENVGLAVPDWPLAFNRINPEGWWKLHPHRVDHYSLLLDHFRGAAATRPASARPPADVA